MQTRIGFRHVVGTAMAVVMIAGLAAVTAPAPIAAMSTSIVISQAYGGGGNSGALWKNDFIELFNLGTSAVDVTGWSLQYAASAGTTWSKTDLTGVIAPGQYYLVKEAAGAGGSLDLPTADITGTLAMAGSAGKVALLSTNALVAGTACPTSGVVDILGYGSATTCSEGTPTPNLSNTTAAVRKGGGCIETDLNSADFSIGAPTPRNTATTVNVCVYEPDLGLTKTGPAAVAAGDGIQYALTLGNIGSVTATGTLVTDTLPAQVTYVGYATELPATFSQPSAGVLVWDLGDVAPGAAGLTITVQGTVQAGLPGGTVFTNTVMASTTGAETALDNNTALWPSQIGSVDLAVTKAGPAAVDAGQDLAFTIEYANEGSLPASGVRIVDVLPPSLTYVADSAGGVHANGVITWEVGPLASGASGTLVLTASTSTAGLYTNTVTIGGDGAEGDPSDNTAVWPFTVNGADPYVLKAGPALLFGGDVAAYTITYGNSGSLPADVTITDALPAGFTTADIAGDTSGLASDDGPGTRSWMTTLPAGSSASFTLSLTVPTSIAGGTRVTNTVEVASLAAGNDPANDTAQATGTVYQIVPIATARAGSTGQVFAVEGTVTAEPGIFQYSGKNAYIYIQDGTGGILLYFNGNLVPVARSNSVRAVGAWKEYYTETELELATAAAVVDLGPGLAVTPLVTATGSVNESLEGQLVQVAGTVTAKPSAARVQLNDGSGMVELYRMNPLGTPTDPNYIDLSTISVGDFVRVTGPSRPYSSGAIRQVLPRGPADVWRQPTGFIIGKSAPESVTRGSEFTYTLTIKNDVGGVATNVVITDAVPTNLTIGDVSDGGEVLAGNVVSWTVASIPENGTIHRTVSVTAPDVNTTLVNADYGVYASEYLTRVLGLPVNTRVVLFDCSTCKIQGAGDTSPFVGQVMAASGVIYDLIRTSSSSGAMYYGFFMQAPAGMDDGDPATSNGLYVYLGTATSIGGYTPAVGDSIVVTGTIDEYSGLTELKNPTAAVRIETVADLDAAVPPTALVPLNETAADNAYRETLESMRVVVPANALVVAPTYYFASTNDTEFYVIRGDHPVALRADPYARRVWRDGEELDNGVADGNSYRISVEANVLKGNANDYSIQMPRANVYDVVTNPLVGALTYAYSRYTLMVEDTPVLSATVDPAANAAPKAADRTRQYSVATMNVENLYDYWNDANDGCDFLGDGPCPGVTPPINYVPENLAAYQTKLQKLAREVVDGMHNPDIIGIQEAEDQDVCSGGGQNSGTCGAADNADGMLDALQDLAKAIYVQSGNVISYSTAVDRAGVDYRGIIVAYMYRNDRVALVPPSELASDPVLGTRPADTSVISYTHNAEVLNPKALQTNFTGGGKLFERLPQVALWRIHILGPAGSDQVELYTIGNHFKSGPDTNVQLRTEQANYNAQLVSEIQAVTPEANVVVLGDLNVYPDSPQLAGLSALGNLYYQIPAASRYTYTYQGQTQTLDQILVTGTLSRTLVEARVAHVNADWSYDFAGDATVSHQASDHDPVVAVFKHLFRQFMPLVGRAN